MSMEGVQEILGVEPGKMCWSSCIEVTGHDQVGYRFCYQGSIHFASVPVEQAISNLGLVSDRTALKVIAPYLDACVLIACIRRVMGRSRSMNSLERHCAPSGMFWMPWKYHTHFTLICERMCLAH